MKIIVYEFDEKLKEKFFKTQLDALRAEKEEKQKRYKEWKAFEDRELYGGFSTFDFLGYLFSQMLQKPIIPESSFSFLELEHTASVEDINKAFKIKSLKVHPDKGGNHDDFIKLTEAKNNCLFYANKNI